MKTRNQTRGEANLFRMLISHLRRVRPQGDRRSNHTSFQDKQLTKAVYLIHDGCPRARDEDKVVINDAEPYDIREFKTITDFGRAIHHQTSIAIPKELDRPRVTVPYRVVYGEDICFEYSPSAHELSVVVANTRIPYDFPKE